MPIDDKTSSIFSSGLKENKRNVKSKKKPDIQEERDKRSPSVAPLIYQAPLKRVFIICVLDSIICVLDFCLLNYYFIDNLVRK